MAGGDRGHDSRHRAGEHGEQETLDVEAEGRSPRWVAVKEDLFVVLEFHWSPAYRGAVLVHPSRSSTSRSRGAPMTRVATPRRAQRGVRRTAQTRQERTAARPAAPDPPSPAHRAETTQTPRRAGFHPARTP